MNLLHFLFVALMVVLATPFHPSMLAAADPVVGEVVEVTLYRGQAMVTRSVPAEGKKGTLEVVVTNLPEQIVTGSIFAEGNEKIEVRAVQFRNRAVGEEPREEVRALDVSIEEVNQKIEINKKALEVMAKRIQYLDNLDTFVTQTAKADLAKGALDAIALEKISTFSFDQRKLVTEEQIKLNAEAKQLKKELDLLTRKRAELTGGATSMVREAVLFLQKLDDEKQNVRLNYLVGNCGWSPSYTLRAGADREKVALEYNALIHQLSGESWSNVKLSLSTASPALSSAGPGLAPYRVTLSSPQQKEQRIVPGSNVEQLLAQVQSIKGRQYAAIEQNLNALSFRDNTATAWGINDIANELQSLELLCGRDFISTLNVGANEQGDGPSLNYQLANSVSLPSRNDQQMVRIVQADIPSEFYHIATPVLTSYVYREAELTNDSPEDLLAGPVAVYLEGRFVGRTEIPTVARGQNVIVGFGADPQLRTRRELTQKQDDVKGGNRELQFTYRLIIENYQDQAAPVRIIDRIPVAGGDSDIQVTLGETTDDLSKDKLYVRDERPSGILRWDIETDGNATGEDARLIEYSYSVEYDRNYRLASPSGTVREQQEFEQQQRGRLKR